MKHVVRKVESAAKKMLGFGVFKRYQLPESEHHIVNIRSCSDLDDPRPLHEQGKAVRLLGLYPNVGEATSKAIALDVESRQIR